MDSLVPDLVAQSCRRHADRPAVGSLTYGLLAARANQLASALAARGVGPDRVVAVCLPRGADAVTAALGVLRAGGAYLPLDPVAPPARLRLLIARSAAVALVTTPDLAARIGADVVTTVLLDWTGLDSTAPPPASADDLAYVIYTSGSTGEPKGVQVSHRSLHNFTELYRRRFDLGQHDRIALIAAPGFDATIMETWPALVAGAHLVVPDDDVRVAPERLRDWLVEHRVTHCFLPTPLGELLIALPWPADTALRAVSVGGDRLHLRPSEDLPFQVVNVYGPTENTVISTFGHVAPIGPLPPSIGTPVTGVDAHVLDADLRPVAVGEAGELYLGGLGLARGYLGRPDLTADRFVPHPWRAGARLYRTGDIVRPVTDGSLEFVGRADDQVKIRGHRIEPGEVAAILRAHPELRAAHVTPFDDHGEIRLVAYVVPDDIRRPPSVPRLRDHLRERLPAIMVPHAFIRLADLPVTERGKVDRHALPDPRRHGVIATTPSAPPRTPLEHRIAALWCEVLALDSIGVHDDFLAVGGQSLIAATLCARIRLEFGVDLTLRDLLGAPTVAELAALLAAPPRHAVHGELPPFTSSPDDGPAPMSRQQAQVWFLDKLAPDSIAYHAQATLRVRGPLDLTVLARALTTIQARHQILRTTYTDTEAGPRQLVHPPAQVRVTPYDLRDLPPGDRERETDRIIATELARPFDLSTGPLARWYAIRLADEETELFLVEHHMVHDGWSFAVLMRELDVLYAAYLANEPDPLPPLPVQYRDYARWQHDALNSPALLAQRDHWRVRLADAPRDTGLPTDHPRPPAQTFNGALFRRDLPPELPEALRQLSAREGVTLYMTLYATFVVLLYRYSGTRDICVGSAFANRRQPETQRLIGMFVNTVVLRCPVRPDSSFRDLLAQARDVVLDATANQEYPFAQLVDELDVRRDPTRNPLFQAMFSFHDSAVREPTFGGRADTTVFERGNGSSKVDLDVVAIPHAGRYAGDGERGDDRITLLWEYNSDLFDEDTMLRMFDQFVRLLRAVVDDPDATVAQLPLLSDAERRAALTQGQGAPSLAGEPVHRQVLAMARRLPTAVAIQAGDQRITYGELADRAVRLAAALGAHGVGEEAVVGICLPRGADLVVAEFGVLLAGAACLPLDPEQPPRRRNAILADAGAAVVVTTAGRAAEAPPGVVVVPPDAAATAPADLPDVTADHLAYVIYTSGSAGQPKGVLIPHRALANFVGWRHQALGYRQTDHVGMAASPAFDVSAGEIWPALAAGATLHPVDDATRLSPERLRAWLADDAISVLDLPTVLAEGLITDPAAAPGALRALVTGGERVSARPPKDAPYVLVNEYGPTEATVSVTAHVVAPDREGAPAIGVPIAGCVAFVLDDELSPVPPGVAGELYVGGACLARGYLGRPDRTADRFVPDPFATTPGARLYRTGDLARRDVDGTLWFVGRVDDQVKVRGYRIEPAEVNAALRRLPEVADSFVTARTDPRTGQAGLVAYLVLRAGATMVGSGALRSRLADDLPAYLIPGAYVVLDALPLTRNGKVDQAALPAPSTGGSGDHQPPVTPTELRVAEAWRTVLGLDTVGATDNFFDVGGNSLLLAEVHRRLSTGWPELTLVALLHHTTIRALGRHLDDRVPAPAERGEQWQQGRARLGRRREQVTGTN